jgi:hypothetical protein
MQPTRQQRRAAHALSVCTRQGPERVGCAGIWPGTRAPPRRRAPSLAAPATGEGDRVSIEAPLADGSPRTAGDVLRTSGGVGGERS